MAETIDSLQIEVNAKATKANDAIDRLVGKLDRLTTSLGKLDGGGSKLAILANGVQRLGNAMQVMNTIKTADFTRLATNLTRLGSINMSALNSAASSMSHFAGAFNSLGTVSANAQSVGEMAKNIAKLGNKSVQTAITNIPQLATALNNLMATLSKSPKVSQNVIQMTNALANLASQGSKVGSASNSIVKGLNKTTTATKKAGSGFKGLASYIGKFYATYFMVIRGMKQLWSSIESTADYIEAYNYFNVSLGKIGADWSHQYEQYGYESAESYAESFKTRLSDSLKKLSGVQVSIGADGQGLLTESGMKNLGLNIQEITQYASQLASVTNSVGQTGEVSLAVASSFTKLAGDISSLFNVDYSSVSKNLQSGLIGQSRALYKYGIDITNATLQTYAYNLGLSKSVSEMTQAEKMQLRMLAILDQSKVSWGDLANTINSPSNMIRQFKNNLKETGMVLGQLFIPVLQKVLPVINGVSIAFKRLLVDIAGFLNIEIDFDAFGQGYSDIGDELDDSADAFDNAIQKAEEYKNQLLGFDEVTRLEEPTEDIGTSTGSGGIDLTEQIKKASSEYEKVWSKAYDKMENQATTIAGKVEKAFEPLKNIFKYFVAGDFEKSGTELAEWINKGLTDYDWGKIGTFIGNKITGTIDFVSGFANNLDWKQLARNFTSVINNAIKNIDVGALADAINGLLNGIWDFAVTTLETLNWGELAKKIGQLLKELDWGVIAKIGFTVGVAKLAGKFLKIFGTNLTTGFTSVFSGFATNSTIISRLTTAGSKMGTVLANAFKSPITIALASIAVIISSASKDYEEVAEAYSKAMGEISPEMQSYFDDIKSKLKGVQDNMNSLNLGYTNADTEAQNIQTIADKYFTLAEKVGKTKEEMELLEAYKQELAEKGGSGIKTILDNENESYEKQKEAIQGIIDNLREKALTEAASKKISETTSLMLEQKSVYDELADKTKDLHKQWDNVYDSVRSGQEEIRKFLQDKANYTVDYKTGQKIFTPQAKKEFEKQMKQFASPIFIDEIINDYSSILRRSIGTDFENTLGKWQGSTENLWVNSQNLNKEYEESNKLLKQSKDTLDELSVTMDYYVGISSGAISTQTSLYEYQKQVAEAEKKAAEEAKVAMNYAKNAADDTKTTIDGKFKPENFTQLGANAAGGIASGMSSKRQDILNITNQIGSDIRGKFNASNYIDSGKNVTGGIASGMNDAGQKTALRTVSDSVRNLINRSFNNSTDFVTFGKNMLEGLKTGLSNNPLIKSITGTVTTLADKVKGIFPNIFNMHSPSKLFEQFGKYTLEGYEIGVEKNADKSIKAVRNWGYELQNMATASLPDFSYSSSPTYAQNTVSNNIYNNSEEVALLRQQVSLLQSLLAKDNVVISPDADGIFKMVQGKANNYTRQTGNSAFLV